MHGIFAHFRTRRMRLFEERLRPSAATRILDVGGSPLIWEFTRVSPRVTFLNLPSALSPHAPYASQVGGDGRLLPFPDHSFDIVFSNSVIEHVGTYDDQLSFAREVARVGRSYWIQTPNRRSPFEMHLMLPFVHRMPRQWQQRIVNRFTLWELMVKPTPGERASYLEHFLNELNLLDEQTLASLFPEASILKETILGLPKSLIAFRSC
ncbi:MAG: class I SAM-dependent methyltransferase [Acidobacteriales bacterium]|nr:class I SAM-dependent methyltransferase [Terriglobales bacterium]